MRFSMGKKVLVLIALIIFVGLIWSVFTERSELANFDKYSSENSAQDMVVSRIESESAHRDFRESEVLTDRNRPSEQEKTYDEEEIYFPRFDQMTEEELDELEEFYDEVELRWSEGVVQLFTQEMGLDQSVIERYSLIRDSFEDARWEAFEEFHEDLFRQEGDEFRYRITDYQENIEEPLAERFRREVLDLVGEDNFIRFLEFKDQFNDELRIDQDPRRGLLKIHL